MEIGLTKRQRKRERFATLLAVLIGIFLLNLLASRHFIRVDLTSQKNYTLAPSTKTILKTLEDMVLLRLYFSKELPPELVSLRGNVEDLLSEFKTYAGPHIRVEFHDPQENPVEEQKVQMMGIPPVEVNVIKKDRQELAKVYLGMTVHFASKQEVIPLIQSSRNLEYELISNIIKVTQTEKPKLGWIGPEENPNPEEATKKESFGLVQDYLEKRFNVQYIGEDRFDRLLPKEVPLVLFPTPEQLSEAQKEAFQTYLDEGGKAILLIDRFKISMGLGIRPEPKENPLEDLLKSFGVSVNADLVLDPSNAMATFTGGMLAFHMPYPYWVRIRPEGFDKEEPIVSELNSLVLPWVSSLSVEKALPKDVSVKTLFQTSPTAVKNEKVDPIQSLDPEATRQVYAQGAPGTYPLGVRIDKKLLVIGNTRFLQDNFLEQFEENIVFLENAIDAFSTGDLLIGIRSKGSDFKPITLLSDSLRQWTKWMDTLIGPLLLAGVGLWIYWKRKSQAKRLKEAWG